MSSNELDIIEKLKDGKIGIFPTDTAFGIGCRMDNVDSVNRIYSVRNRPSEKALLVLVSSLEMARKYVDIDIEVENKLLKRYWPGGLTVIFNCFVKKVPSVVRANGKTLAMRLPNHKQIVEIIEKVGVPIVAPSANLSGEKTPTKISDIDKSLLEKVDFFLPGVCTMEGVSTIIDASKKPWEKLRDGVVNAEY